MNRAATSRSWTKNFPGCRVVSLSSTRHPIPLPSTSASQWIPMQYQTGTRIYLPKSIQMLTKLQIFRNFKPPYQSTYFTLNQIFVFIEIVRLYKEKFKSQINDCTLESIEKNAQGRFSKTGHMSSFGKLQVGMSLSAFFLILLWMIIIVGQIKHLFSTKMSWQC